MKILAVASVLLFSTFAHADFPAPKGMYKGTGQLIRLADGTKVTYNASYDVEENAINASYADATGAVTILPFTLLPTTAGQFSVSIGHDQVGSGFCINRSCQVTANFSLNGVPQEVALTFTYVPNCEGIVIVVSGKNMTNGTVFEDVVRR